MRTRCFKAGALALAISLLMGACGTGGTGSGTGTSGGGGAAGQGATASVNKELVWRMEPLDIDAEFDMENINGGIIHAGEKLYLFGEKEVFGENSYEHEVYVVRCNPDGTGAEKIVLDNPAQGTWYSSFCVGDDGALYAVKTVYPEGMYAPVPENGAPINPAEDGMTEISEGEVEFTEAPEETGTTEESETQEDAAPGAGAAPGEGQPENYFIVKFDASGESVFETKVTREKEGSAEQWYAVSGMKFSSGKLVVAESDGISVFSAEDGSRGKSVFGTESYPTMVSAKGGDVYLNYWDDAEAGMSIVRVDVAQEKTEDKIKFPETMLLYDMASMNPGFSTDFIMTDNAGVYSWNVGDANPVQIMGFIDSDLDIDFFESLAQTSETGIVALYNKGGSRTLGRFSKVDPADVQDRKTLMLACNYLDQTLRSAVVQFNQKNTEYRVSVHDYSKYATEEDWEAGYKQLNSDIISGNAPDMLVMDSGRYTRIYQMKGLLEPLDSYIESDPEIGQNEYVDSVFNAYSYQGKIYLLTPAFMMRTYAVKASDAAQIKEWSLGELQRLMEERDIDPLKVFGEWPMTQANMLQNALVFDGKNYFDWDAHQVKFDSPAFLELLNFAKQFPEQVDYSSLDADTSGYFRTGEALVAQGFFGNFSDFRRLKYGTFGEDIEFVGFPREDGKGGSSVLGATQIAMSAESDNKDACWQFMRTFLTDEYQQLVLDEMGYLFPVSRKHLQKMAEKAMERESFTDENGETVYLDESYYINGEQIVLEQLTQEDIDQVMALFETVDSGYDYDETLINMVSEETAPFFKGQKSAEECAKILQSKAQIYIDENS